MYYKERLRYCPEDVTLSDVTVPRRVVTVEHSNSPFQYPRQLSLVL